MIEVVFENCGFEPIEWEINHICSAYLQKRINIEELKHLPIICPVCGIILVRKLTKLDRNDKTIKEAAYSP